MDAICISLRRLMRSNRKAERGHQVLISGVIYTARDAAHHRLVEALDRGEKLPFDLKGRPYITWGHHRPDPGRSSAPPGRPPAGRMDAYTPRLLAAGIKAMIGKGSRSPAVREAIRSTGRSILSPRAAPALCWPESIKQAEVVAYEDLGTEAVLRLDRGGLSRHRG